MSSKGVHVDESKINAIKTWLQPTNLQQVCSFLGLVGFYRRFVKDFSTIALPLHALSKKNAPFVSGPSQDAAFNELKNLLTHAPVLALPNFDKPFEIHCDASGNGIGGVLTLERNSITPSMTKSYMLLCEFCMNGNITYDLMSSSSIPTMKRLNTLRVKLS